MLLKSTLESSPPLSRVSLPHDYVQLHFEQIVLTLYSRLRLIVENDIVAQDNPGFAVALSALIGQRVLTADYASEQHLSLSFSGGTVLAASLRADETIGPELFQLSGPGLPLLVEQVA